MTNGEYQTAATWTAMYQLVRAYLAANPADDDERIDDAWLIDMGFKHRYGNEGYYTDSLTLKFANDCWGCWLWCMQAEHQPCLVVLFTRGDFRRLCSALGITTPPTNERDKG